MDQKGKNMRPPEAKLTTNKYDPKKETQNKGTVTFE